MALDVNGYNSVFKGFVDFAQRRADAGKGTAVVTASLKQDPLDGRQIMALKTSRTDSVHKWTRGVNEWKANDRTRTYFRNAVADMFGGESKIPAEVKKAMLLSDYDSGKPLTARRILAVKQAIDANGVAKARSARIQLETFRSPDVRAAALGMGYMEPELRKLARAAHFYAEAKGVSEMEAMREVGRPGSEANRLMNYGGRFLKSASNFQDGLRLISQFSDWHDGLSRSLADRNAPKDTPTKRNLDVRAGARDAKLGLERFLFEDIAVNPGFDLGETDPERAFGVEHNTVGRFMTTAANTSILGTLVNVPPKQRRVVCAAFNALATLATDAKPAERIIHESIFLAHVLRNLPKLEAIMARTGTLTGRDVIKNCFPEIRRPGNCDIATVRAWEDEISTAGLRNPRATPAIMAQMESAGATFNEAANAVAHGKTLPTLPYYSDAQYSIQEASSVAACGLATMNRDICRQSGYTVSKGGQDRNAFPEGNLSWKFNFPDGERLKTRASRQGDIPRVGEKIRQLCGDVHQKQIGAVGYMLSQSALSPMVQKPLAKYGIVTNEHSPVDFTLSRDPRTGAVTITYSSPKELPVKFSWTATVAVDGTVRSTPFTITGEAIRNLSSKAAKAMVQDAARAMGRNLSSRELSAAADILRRNADGLWPENAKLFAQFVVKLPLDAAHAAGSGQKAESFASEIRQWRDFDLGDLHVTDVADAVKADSNADIAKKMADPGSFGNVNRPDAANVYSVMIDDAHRNVYVINGRRFDSSDPNSPHGEDLSRQVIAAFKGAAPSEKAQKALSCLMHQGMMQNFMSLAMKAPPDPGEVAMHERPGADLFASRDMTTGHFALALLDNSTMQTTYTLDVAPDGNTATVTVTASPGLTEGFSPGDVFGHVQLTRQMTVDLRPDVPVVTDVKLAQKLVP